MPDRRHHRGRHPEDDGLFGPDTWEVLRRALVEFCWLLDREYSATSALKLVGDRYQLKERQRLALLRCSCTNEQCQDRDHRRLSRSRLASRQLWIDGYNVLLTVEAALGGAVLLVGRDGSIRDMCSMHGTYRKVQETEPAARLIGEYCAESQVEKCVWLLDSPVSNSGRLKSFLGEVAEEAGWDWEIELVHDPDSVLSKSAHIVASADSVILDRCSAWFPLGTLIIQERLQPASLVDLALPFRSSQADA